MVPECCAMPVTLGERGRTELGSKADGVPESHNTADLPLANCLMLPRLWTLFCSSLYLICNTGMVTPDLVLPLLYWVPYFGWNCYSSTDKRNKNMKFLEVVTFGIINACCAFPWRAGILQ